MQTKLINKITNEQKDKALVEKKNNITSFATAHSKNRQNAMQT